MKQVVGIGKVGKLQESTKVYGKLSFFFKASVGAMKAGAAPQSKRWCEIHEPLPKPPRWDAVAKTPHVVSYNEYKNFDEGRDKGFDKVVERFLSPRRMHWDHKPVGRVAETK